MSNTINVDFLLEEISARTCKLKEQTQFGDPCQKAFHDGQLAQLLSLAAMIKNNIVQATESTTVIDPRSGDKTNDPNFFTINLQTLLNKICICVCQLQATTTFTDPLLKCLHDGKLAEALSIQALVNAQIYQD